MRFTSSELKLVAFLLFVGLSADAFSPVCPQILSRSCSSSSTADGLRSTVLEPSSTDSSTQIDPKFLSSEAVEASLSSIEASTSSSAKTDPVAEILERGNEDEIMALLTPNAINERLTAQLEKMKIKDQTSKSLTKEDLDILYEDEHIVAVNKPAGVLCVPGKGEGPCLSQAVFDNIDGITLPDPDRMVVHRLGFDTTGVMVFAKTMEGLRGMNIRFRTREVDRTYEALLCGHVEADKGKIDLPLMRCLLYPPFIRVSTMNAQCAIAKTTLTHEDIGRKYLEEPKESVTRFEVLSRETLNGLPVTRVQLRSISGRTHQLNVHCAAFGHPIVGDFTYGVDGETAPYGGLTLEECEEVIPNPARASPELQRQIQSLRSPSDGMCIHAKSIEFDHPKDKRVEVSLSCDAPF